MTNMTNTNTFVLNCPTLASYATMLVEQMSLVNGSATALDGGGGYFGFGAHVKTTNTVVKNNYATRRGGGLALDSTVGLSDVNAHKQAVLFAPSRMGLKVHGTPPRSPLQMAQHPQRSISPAQQLLVK